MRDACCHEKIAVSKHVFAILLAIKNPTKQLTGGWGYHLSVRKNAFEFIVRMKEITAVVHATAMFIADHVAR